MEEIFRTAGRFTLSRLTVVNGEPSAVIRFVRPVPVSGPWMLIAFETDLEETFSRPLLDFLLLTLPDGEESDFLSSVADILSIMSYVGDEYSLNGISYDLLPHSEEG